MVRHQHRARDEQAGEHEAREDPVRHFLETAHEEIRIGCFDFDLEFGIGDGVEDFVEALRQGGGEMGATKLKFNFGLGINEPTFVESFSTSPFFRRLKSVRAT